MTYGTEPRRRRGAPDSSRADEAEEAENWLAAYRPAPDEQPPRSFNRDLPGPDHHDDEPTGRHGRHSRHAEAPQQQPRHVADVDAPTGGDIGRPGRGGRSRSVRGRPVSGDLGRPAGSDAGRIGDASRVGGVGWIGGDIGPPARAGGSSRARFAEASPVDPYPPIPAPAPIEPPPAGRRRSTEPDYPAEGRRSRRRGRAEDAPIPSPVDPAAPISGSFGPVPPVSGAAAPLRPVSGGPGPLPPIDRPVSGAARGTFTPIGPRIPAPGRPMAPPTAATGWPPGTAGEMTNGWAGPGYDEPPMLRTAGRTRRGGRPPDPGRPEFDRTDTGRPDLAGPDLGRPEPVRADRGGRWTDPGTRRVRLAERDDLVPPDMRPMMAGHPRSRLWMGTLVFIGVVVVLAVCALGTYFVVNDERHGPADLRSGASGPPLQKRDISSRAVDPAPLTEAEVFPKAQIIAAANEPPYQVLKTQAAADCKIAATGDLAALLQQGGCSQVVRGTLKSPNGAYLITAGVFNLVDEAAATAVHRAIKDIVDGQKGRFNGFAAGSGTEAIIRAPTHLGWNVRGHYLAYCVIARTDGQPFADGDAFPQQIIFDLVETHLRDTVVGGRAVINPSVSAKPSTGG